MIFEEAIKEINKYNQLGQKNYLSINLSPKQLINKNIFEDFLKIVKQYNIDSTQITESVMLEKEDGFELINKFS